MDAALREYRATQTFARCHLHSSWTAPWLASATRPGDPAIPFLTCVRSTGPSSPRFSGFGFPAASGQYKCGTNHRITFLWPTQRGGVVPECRAEVGKHDYSRRPYARSRRVGNFRQIGAIGNEADAGHLRRLTSGVNRLKRNAPIAIGLLKVKSVGVHFGLTIRRRSDAAVPSRPARTSAAVAQVRPACT